MLKSRNRVPGSVFKKFFIMISVSVLLSIAVSGIILLFLYANLWNQERLDALSNDALSLSQSVDFLFLREKNLKKRAFDNEQVILAVASSLSSVAVTADEDVFIVDDEGRIALCRDLVSVNDDSLIINNNCPVHSGLIFPQTLVDLIAENKEKVFTFEGPLPGIASGDCFLAAVPLSAANDGFYIYVMQAKGDAYLPYTTNYLRIIIIAELFAVLITFIASIVISFKMTTPIKKITQATKHYAGGDFSVRIAAADDYRELQELVQSVNTMADNLAVLEESRSNFVANVSHELKTPMTIIGGFIDGMLDGTIPENEHEKYLGIVSKEVRRLSRLVVAMLNMSKIQAGKLTLTYSPVELYDLICRIVISFEPVLEEKNINVTGLETAEKLIINADDALINQIFYNLIDNAVKFTPERGEIRITLHQEKKNAVIVVRNTGCGLTEDECSLIFDRFYKTDRSRGLDAKSFGLGLYIVKSVIELHSGSIRINSEPDEYTEFEIKLPI